MSDLGLDLGAVALACGLKLAGAEAMTTYREDGQTADGAAAEPCFEGVGSTNCEPRDQ